MRDTLAPMRQLAEYERMLERICYAAHRVDNPEGKLKAKKSTWSLQLVSTELIEEAEKLLKDYKGTNTGEWHK